MLSGLIEFGQPGLKPLDPLQDEGAGLLGVGAVRAWPVPAASTATEAATSTTTGATALAKPRPQPARATGATGTRSPPAGTTGRTCRACIRRRICRARVVGMGQPPGAVRLATRRAQTFQRFAPLFFGRFRRL